MLATPPVRPPRGARSPAVSPSPSRPLGVLSAARSPGDGEAYGGGTPRSAAAATRATPFVAVQGAPVLNAELCAGADLRSSLGDEPLCYFQWYTVPPERVPEVRAAVRAAGWRLDNAALAALTAVEGARKPRLVCAPEHLGLHLLVTVRPKASGALGDDPRPLVGLTLRPVLGGAAAGSLQGLSAATPQRTPGGRVSSPGGGGSPSRRRVSNGGDEGAAPRALAPALAAASPQRSPAPPKAWAADAAPPPGPSAPFLGQAATSPSRAAAEVRTALAALEAAQGAARADALASEARAAQQSDAEARDAAQRRAELEVAAASMRAERAALDAAWARLAEERAALSAHLSAATSPATSASAAGSSARFGGGGTEQRSPVTWRDNLVASRSPGIEEGGADSGVDDGSDFAYRRLTPLRAAPRPQSSSSHSQAQPRTPTFDAAAAARLRTGAAAYAAAMRQPGSPTRGFEVSRQLPGVALILMALLAAVVGYYLARFGLDAGGGVEALGAAAAAGRALVSAAQARSLAAAGANVDALRRGVAAALGAIGLRGSSKAPPPQRAGSMWPFKPAAPAAKPKAAPKPKPVPAAPKAKPTPPPPKAKPAPKPAPAPKAAAPKPAAPKPAPAKAVAVAKPAVKAAPKPAAKAAVAARGVAAERPTSALRRALEAALSRAAPRVPRGPTAPPPSRPKAAPKPIAAAAPKATPKPSKAAAPLPAAKPKAAPPPPKKKAAVRSAPQPRPAGPARVGAALASLAVRAPVAALALFSGASMRLLLSAGRALAKPLRRRHGHKAHGAAELHGLSPAPGSRLAAAPAGGGRYGILRTPGHWHSRREPHVPHHEN